MPCPGHVATTTLLQLVLLFISSIDCLPYSPITFSSTLNSPCLNGGYFVSTLIGNSMRDGGLLDRMEPQSRPRRKVVEHARTRDGKIVTNDSEEELNNETIIDRGDGTFNRTSSRQQNRRGVMRFADLDHYDEAPLAVEVARDEQGHCVCPIHFTGRRCELRIPGGCVHGSKMDDSGKCRCMQYWTGQNCEQPICVNGLIERRSMRCFCSVGWLGTHCHISYCGTHGRPLTDNPSQCACDDGWTGKDCRDAVTEITKRFDIASAMMTGAAALLIPAAAAVILLRFHSLIRRKLTCTTEARTSMREMSQLHSLVSSPPQPRTHLLRQPPTYDEILKEGEMKSDNGEPPAYDSAIRLLDDVSASLP